MPERVVVFRLRSIFAWLGVLLAVVAAVGFVFLAQAALTLIAIALFLALALNPGVDFFARRGLGRIRSFGFDGFIRKERGIARRHILLFPDIART